MVPNQSQATQCAQARANLHGETVLEINLPESSTPDFHDAASRHALRRVNSPSGIIQTAIFGKRNKNRRQDHPAGRMIPPDQGFEADDSPINKRLGLIEKLKFALCQSRSEIVLKSLAFRATVDPFQVQKTDRAGPLCLGAIECRIGVTDQLLTFGGITW